MKKLPPKWTSIYPRGTEEGDEECRFFKVLERHPNYVFQSTEGIARESKLSPERVEQILNKYLPRNMVFQNPDNHEQWGYWERCPELIEKKSSLSRDDQRKRVDDAMGGQTTFSWYVGVDPADDTTSYKRCDGKVVTLTEAALQRAHPELFEIA